MRFVSSYFLICFLCCITFLTACSYVTGNSTDAPSIGSGSNQSVNSFSILVNNGNNPRAGQSITVTVTALNSNGQTATTFSGLLSVLTSDGAATFPSSISLVNGTGTFTITLNTLGSQTITITFGSISSTISVTVLSSEAFGSIGWINAYSNTFYSLNPSNLCSDLTSSATNVAAPQWCSGAQTQQILNTAGGFSSLIDMTVEPSGTYLYVVEQFGYKITRIVKGTGAFAGSIGDSSTAGSAANGLPGCVIGVQTGWCNGGTFISSTKNGGFGIPVGIASDATNLYISDSGNNAVYKFTLAGTFVGAIGFKTTVSNTCQSGGQRSWCVATDTNPAKFDNGTAFSNGADGLISNPNNITVGGGYLYVSSSWYIQRFDAATGLYQGSIGQLRAASALPVSGATVSACPSSTIAPAPTWCSRGTFTIAATDGSFTRISGIAVDTTGNFLYIADYPLHRVNKYNATTGQFLGSIGHVTGSVNTGTVTSPRCPITAQATNAWCTGGIFATVNPSVDGGLITPYGMGFDSTNNLIFVADASSSQADSKKVTRFNASTGQFLGSIGLSSTAVNIATQLPFTNPDSSPGVQCNTSSTPTPAVNGWCYGGYFTAGNGDGQFSRTYGVYYFNDATNPALFVADNLNSSITKFYPTGKITP